MSQGRAISQRDLNLDKVGEWASKNSMSREKYEVLHLG